MKCCYECEETENLIYCRWECKLVHTTLVHTTDKPKHSLVISSNNHSISYLPKSFEKKMKVTRCPSIRNGQTNCGTSKQWDIIYH